MIERVLLDTGPLVAALDGNERHHGWVLEQLRAIKPPLITNEAVLTEAFYLLRKNPVGISKIQGYLHQGVIEIKFCLNDHFKEIFGLIRKYKNVPMSLADACLVYMSSLISKSHVFTLDSDFRIYRQPNRRIIPSIIPTYEGF